MGEVENCGSLGLMDVVGWYFGRPNRICRPLKNLCTPTLHYSPSFNHLSKSPLFPAQVFPTRLSFMYETKALAN